MLQYERESNSNYYLDSNLWFCCRWFLQFIKLADMKTRIKKIWQYFCYINKEVLTCQVFTGRGKF